jgi:hypothetical protein
MEPRSSVYTDEIPIVRINYREFAVNMIFQRAFSLLPLPTGVEWIDNIIEREGFLRAFKDNMRRMLNTGEYFALLKIVNDKIKIDRVPREWVTNIIVSEQTGELLLLIYTEPIIIPDRVTKTGWRKITWSPTTIKTAISLDDNSLEESAYKNKSVQPNPYGFVPIIPFKLGTKVRGEPIWKPADGVIRVLEDIYNDIRLINAYHSAPIKYIKTDAEFKGIGPEGFVQIGTEDDIGALTYTIGESLFNEFVFAIGILSDILGIPPQSILQVGKHASGEAIEKRLDTLNRQAKSLREYVGEQMRLMFKMMSALVSKGLIEVDLEDPSIQPLITDQVILPEDSYEQRENAITIFALNVGIPVELNSELYDVPDIKWVPIEKINPQDFLQLIQGLAQAIETNLMTLDESRKILAMNIEHLMVATDLVTTDKDELASATLARRAGVA